MSLVPCYRQNTGLWFLLMKDLGIRSFLLPFWWVSDINVFGNISSKTSKFLQLEINLVFVRPFIMPAFYATPNKSSGQHFGKCQVFTKLVFSSQLSKHWPFEAIYNKNYLWIFIFGCIYYLSYIYYLSMTASVPPSNNT